MSKTVSIKGVVIDFDLLRVQQSLSSGNAPSIVVERQMSIEERIHRRRIQRNQRKQSKIIEALEVSQGSVPETYVIEEIESIPFEVSDELVEEISKGLIENIEQSVEEPKPISDNPPTKRRVVKNG